MNNKSGAKDPPGSLRQAAVRKAHIEIVCAAIKRRHVDSWRVAGVIVAYVYKASRGNQPERTDGKLTAKEFERVIAEAMAADPSYKGIPPISNNTIIRFRAAWQLAAKNDGVVPDADKIEVGQVPATRHITADFDEYLNVVRAGETKTKPYQPPSVDEELNGWVARFEKFISRWEADELIMALTEDEEKRGIEAPSDPAWTARMTDVLAAVRSIAAFYRVDVKNVAPGPQEKLDTWAARMFAALPDRLHQPTHKALVKVLHPDAGGDEEAMKLVNDAYDRRAK